MGQPARRQSLFGILTATEAAMPDALREKRDYVVHIGSPSNVACELGRTTSGTVVYSSGTLDVHTRGAYRIISHPWKRPDMTRIKYPPNPQRGP